MSDIAIPLFQDHAFDPRATEAMRSAYEKTCNALHDNGQPEIVREIIAQRIMEVAKSGERDPERLCARAMVALGIN